MKEHRYGYPSVHELPVAYETNTYDDFIRPGAVQREDIEDCSECIIQFAKSLVAHETAVYPVREGIEVHRSD